MSISRRQFLKRTSVGVGSLLAAQFSLGSQGIASLRSAAAQLDAAPINLLYADFRAEQLLPPLQAAFREATGLDFAATVVPFSDLDRSIRSIPQQTAPPDVVLADGPNVPTYVAIGLLRPVTNAFTEEDFADFFPGVTTSVMLDGEFYGPGTNESSQAIYYDRAVMEKYGIEPPQTLEDAWSWQEALEVFQTIQEGERRDRNTDQFWAIYLGQGGLAGASVNVYTLLCFPRSNGEAGSNTYKAISDDGLTASGYINTPEAVEALQFLQDIFQVYDLCPLSDTSDFFVNEQVAMWLATPFQYGPIVESNPALAERIGVTPFPYFRTPIVQTDALHWCVTSASQNPEAAVELIQFLGSPEGNRIVADVYTSIPIRRSLVSEFPDFEGVLRVFVDTVAEWAQPRPITPGFSEYNLIVGTMLNDIIAGADVQSAADQAAAEVDRQLARYAR